jgi:hypothetical protein
MAVLWRLVQIALWDATASKALIVVRRMFVPVLFVVPVALSFRK